MDYIINSAACPSRCSAKHVLQAAVLQKPELARPCRFERATLSSFRCSCGFSKYESVSKRSAGSLQALVYLATLTECLSEANATRVVRQLKSVKEHLVSESQSCRLPPGPFELLHHRPLSN